MPNGYKPDPTKAVAFATVDLSRLTETSRNVLVVEASEMGLEPGQWPDFILVREHNAQRYSFIRPVAAFADGLLAGAVVYTCGSLELHVRNT